MTAEGAESACLTGVWILLKIWRLPIGVQAGSHMLLKTQLEKIIQDGAANFIDGAISKKISFVWLFPLDL